MAVGSHEQIIVSCDEREKKLLELIRQTEFGEIRIIVQDGAPIRVEEVRKSIKL